MRHGGRVEILKQSYCGVSEREKEHVQCCQGWLVLAVQDLASCPRSKS